MHISPTLLLVYTLTSMYSCGQKSVSENTDYVYYDKSASDTINKDFLVAVTDEDHLQYGARVAYLNSNGDTVIPFNKYAYMGTDTLTHFANVMEHTNDSSYGRWIAIDKNQNRLYDLVFFDNGPDDFKEGFVRAKRNGKMGFANKFGQIVIPCTYDFAWWFESGKAKVTYDAKIKWDKHEEYTHVESNQWFYIDTFGKKTD